MLRLTLALALAAPALAAPPPWEARARDLLARTVAIRGVDGVGEGAKPMAELLAAEFRNDGFADADVRVLPYKHTAALMVRLRAAGSKAKPILLIGHMDVVDARREDWTRDPFTLGEAGGYFYGRGTADMKGGVVAEVITMLRLRADKVPLRRDVVLFLTGDEETDGTGAGKMAGEWRPLYGDAEYALNADAGGGGFLADGKPLGFTIQTAEKAYQTFTLTVTNRGGHSSKPRADNAIYELADALKRVQAHRFTPQLNETTRAYFLASAPLRPAALGTAMRAFAADPANTAAADVIETDAGETGNTRTTCVATMLAAGVAENALPQFARATIQCRVFPGTAAEQVQAELQAAVGSGAAMTVLNAFGNGAPPSPLRADVVGAYTRAVHARWPAAPIIPEQSAGATDGGLLRGQGIPAYGVDGAWGVVPDDMRMHGRDERLPVKAFNGNLDHWYGMVRELAGR